MAEQRKVPFVTLATFNTSPASETKKRRREEDNDTSHGKNGGIGSAATGPGGGSSMFGNMKGNGNVADGTSGEPRAVTVRLNLSLSEPSDKGSAEYNYSELVQATQVKKKKPPQGPPPQGLTPNFDPNDPFGDDAKERMEVEALAKKFESKYGGNPSKKKRKDRIQDLVDIGYGYDETDPFIDNSEAYDELVPASLTTKLGGFYINTGTLQFRPASDSEGDDTTKDGNHLKAPAIEERVIKKRRKKQDGGLELEKKPRKMRVPKTGVSSLNRPEKKKRKKLMKDSLNLAAMLRRFAREKEEIRKKQPGVVKVTRGPNAANATATPNPAATQRPPVAVLNSHPPPGNAVPLGTAVTTPGGDFNMSDLTTDPAVMSLLGGAHDNEMLQDLMGDLDFGLLDSPTPASPRQQAENGNLLPGGQKAVVVPGGVAAAGRIPKGPLNPPPLPSGLPGPLVKRIEDLRAASRQFDQEGRKKFFTLDMNNILLDIELQVQEQPIEARSAVYSHMEAFVPCNKEALLKRLKKLSLNIQDDRLRTPLLKLKLAVCSVMPEQIARFNMDCMARVAKQQSEEGEKNGSEEDDEEKPGKRVMGPRKKFIWDDKLRNLLCILVRVKLGCYEREAQNSLSAEDYLKAFMETEVKPLWPKGWMQARILFRESRMAHNHLTGNSVKKRIVPTPKVKSKEVVWTPRATPVVVDPSSPLALVARQHLQPEQLRQSEPICLSDSLDEDLGTPSLDSISQALALLSNAAKGLIQGDGPAQASAPSSSSSLLQKKGPYVSTSFTGSPTLSSSSMAKGSPLAQAHRHSSSGAAESPRTPGSKASSSSSSSGSPSTGNKARPPPTASPLLPPQHKAFSLAGKVAKGGTVSAAEVILAASAQARAQQHAMAVAAAAAAAASSSSSPHHLASKAQQQQGTPTPSHPTQDSSTKASPAPSPPQPRTPPSQQQQQQQPGFITPMQATLTKSSHSSSSPILKLTPRPPAPTSVAAAAAAAAAGAAASPSTAASAPQARPSSQSLPAAQQYTSSASPSSTTSSSSPASKTPAFRPPHSGTPRGQQGNFAASSPAGQKTTSASSSSSQVTSFSTPAPKHSAAAAAAAATAAAAAAAASSASAPTGQRQRAGSTGGVAAKSAAVSSASTTPQLSQVSSAGSALLGAAGPSLPLGFGMLGGLVPVSLPFQFPSLLNLPPPGVTSATGTAASVTSSSGYSLPQNVTQSQGGDKRKTL
ncbi:ubinuclein-2b isoform X2 [Engraulis encrasicolus]|uniref:ubinuclein-2b isoform X2 n=1 Tax=Engraulis encrasicolus TaxID=184585 RepID=UPI002FCFB722